jgi:protein tyrosine/serine phosphatase
MKRGFLYRSASHSRATDADLDTLSQLDIAVVVDLRRREEREREPSRRPQAFRGVVIEADEQEADQDDWLHHIVKGDLSARAFREFMVDYYRKAPFDPRHQELFRRYFEALQKARGPVLIHCAAGKDRTGLLAALTHHLAGVHPDDIRADYLLTNDRERMARRLPLLAKTIEEISGQTPEDEAVMTAMGVETHYLETAFSEIDARFGDLDGYLEHALGVGRPARERIAERLLEPQ